MAKSKNEELAQNIIKFVGGQENVNNLTHCATRLRFTLIDNSKVDKEAINKLDIIQTIEAGGQFQVVIGPQVGAVYEEVQNYISIDPDKVTNTSNQKLSDKIFDTISGSFTPLIPIICGSGLVKALLTILTMSNLLSDQSSTFSILNAASNGVFYFLPIMLGFTAAQKMKASPYIGATIGAALLEPSFTALGSTGDQVSFLGIPVILQSYASTVLPVFGAIVIFSFVERFLKKVIPASLHMVFIPFLSLLIMIPLTVIVFGPFGVYVAQGISSAIVFLLGKSAILTGAILAALWVPIVVLGLHWAIIPIVISNIAASGIDPLLGLVMGTVWVSGGAAIGVFLKTKDTKLKEVALASTLPCFLSGVSEPIIYGIMFRYKKVFGYVIFMSAVTGALAGALGVEATQLAGGIFTITTFLPVIAYIIVILVGIIGTAALVYLFGYENKEVN